MIIGWHCSGLYKYQTKARGSRAYILGASDVYEKSDGREISFLQLIQSFYIHLCAATLVNDRPLLSRSREIQTLTSPSYPLEYFQSASVTATLWLLNGVLSLAMGFGDWRNRGPPKSIGYSVSCGATLSFAPTERMVLGLSHAPLISLFFFLDTFTKTNSSPL
jgi:hypothetical protein